MGAEAISKQILMISLTRLALLNQEARRQPRANEAQTKPHRLIPIRPVARGGERWPLLLIHPVGGSVMAYFDIARYMDASQPVYAMENQADETELPQAQTVEQIAQQYLEELRLTGVKTPWFLGGYSMGGLVAFEMARQLHAAGRETPAVLIIDTPSKVRTIERGEDGIVTSEELRLMGKMMALRQAKELDLDESLLNGVPAEDRMQVFLDFMKQRGVIPPRVDTGFLWHLIRVVRNNEMAQRQYRPGSYNGLVTLLRARDLSEELRFEAGEIYDDPAFGWQQYCSQTVEVRKIPGEHLRIVNEPHCRTLGSTLQSVMDAQRASRTVPLY